MFAYEAAYASQPKLESEGMMERPNGTLCVSCGHWHEGVQPNFCDRCNSDIFSLLFARYQVTRTHHPQVVGQAQQPEFVSMGGWTFRLSARLWQHPWLREGAYF